jgi:hypothetical protein
VTEEARQQLMAALADLGVDAEDYARIEQARALVDDVNARLSARSSNLVYTVTLRTTPPAMPVDAAAILDAAQLAEQ